MKTKDCKLVITYTLQAETQVQIINGVRAISNAIEKVLNDFQNFPDAFPEFIVNEVPRLTHWNFE